MTTTSQFILTDNKKFNGKLFTAWKVTISTASQSQGFMPYLEGTMNISLSPVQLPTTTPPVLPTTAPLPPEPTPA
jgi:hypothetical protein